YDNTLRYQWTAIGKVKNFYIGANNLLVSKQTRILPLPPAGSPLTTPQQIFSRLITPPAGYMLWGAEAGCTIPVAHQDIHISLSVTNLTNTAYRDYLNLFRYYVDDLGRNVILRVRIPINE
ncbi:MAG TPA: hypothetical protein VK518_15375, partial [Puia sp.]|nr:hypothetical protein [Puia sp.]